MANMERHQEIIGGSDADIYAIADAHQDKQIYEIFYRTCLDDEDVEPKDFEEFCRRINKAIVQKLHLWGFSPRRARRIMKFATADYTPAEFAQWRQEAPAVVEQFDETVGDVTKASATTNYEKCLIAAAREIHHNDGKFIWFELDCSIGQKLQAQGVGKEEIKDILQSESFLLENKRYAAAMAEAIVRQIASLNLPVASRSAEAMQNQGNNVTYNNHYENCTIFLAYNHEAEKDLQRFLERIGDVKLLTFDMSNTPLRQDVPTTAAEAEIVDSPEILSATETTEKQTEEPAAAMATVPVEQPTPESPQSPPKPAMIPTTVPERAKATPRNNGVRKNRKIVNADVGGLGNYIDAEGYNDNLMKIKNYEIIDGVAGSTAEHQYKACAHEFFMKNKVWNIDIERIAVKKLLGQGMIALVLQNAMIKYSPLLGAREETEAKRLAEEIILSVAEPEAEEVSADEPPMDEIAAADIFTAPEPDADDEDVGNFYLDAIDNFRTTKDYQDLPAAEKYLFLAQRILAQKSARRWQSADDLQIVTVLLGEKISREQIASIIAEFTPFAAENRMDYADELLTGVNGDDLPAMTQAAMPPKNNKPAATPDNRMTEGMERIRGVQILNIDFADLPMGMKYLYYAKPMCKGKTWLDENDIEIAKLLRSNGLTDNLIQGAIETHSPLAYSIIDPTAQRAYSEHIIDSILVN
jgi:hypothetical protein